MLRLGLWLILITVSVPAWAKSFSTSYLSLEIPQSWSCRTVNKDWVCQDSNLDRQKQSVLILSAKAAGPEEHFASLREQLKEPKGILGLKRQAITSQLEWSKELTIQNENWAESLHLNRELENFYTYYLATVSRGLTVLISLSFERGQSSQMQPLLQMLRSSVQLTAPTAQPSPTLAPQPVAPQAIEEKSSSPIKKELWIGLAILGLVAMGWALKR